MAEYKPRKLADVEVIAEPTDEAHVLVEQNGEIKRTPKTAVGGGGGIAEPVVFTISNSIVCKPNSTNDRATTYEIVDAYFAGNAYALHDCIPQKIIGFSISNDAVYVCCRDVNYDLGFAMFRISTGSSDVLGDLESDIAAYLS